MAKLHQHIEFWQKIIQEPGMGPWATESNKIVDITDEKLICSTFTSKKARKPRKSHEVGDAIKPWKIQTAEPQMSGWQRKQNQGWSLRSPSYARYRPGREDSKFHGFVLNYRLFKAFGTEMARTEIFNTCMPINKSKLSTLGSHPSLSCCYPFHYLFNKSASLMIYLAL